MIPPAQHLWLALLPLLSVITTAIIVMLADLWTEGPDVRAWGWIGLIGLAATAVTALTLWNTKVSAFSGAIAIDRYGAYSSYFCFVPPRR